jgi:hypothetical protein
MVPTTCDLYAIAPRIVKLVKEIETEVGYPISAGVIVDATNDRVFEGLKQLSWGLLLSKRMRPKFKEEMVRRLKHIKLSLSLVTQNSGTEHDQEIEERKRETRLPAVDDIEPDFDDDEPE